MSIAQKIVKAYLKRIANNEESAVAPGRFIDLAVLLVAYDAFIRYLDAKEAAPSPQERRLATVGLTLLKRYNDDLANSIVQLLGPLAERTDAGSVRTPINMAIRVTTVTPQGIEYRAKALRETLPWIKTHTVVFNDIFTGKVARAARELASVIEEESPASLLNKLANVAPVSGITAPRKWVEDVAKEAGAPISSVENTLVNAQVAKDLGEQLVKIEASLTTVSSNTPEAADLQAQRSALIDQLGKVAQQSANPDTILAVAASAKPTHQFATDTGRKVGLTPDQEEAMMARGRVVIAAGAGSGKTRVLASKVAFHINEQGIPATSLLATSFTGKASAELIKRCGDYGAILQKDALKGFGTTHSIAGGILNDRARDFRRPNYIGKKEGWKQTTIFRLAMDQVKMKADGGPPPTPKGMWDDQMAGAGAPPVAPQAPRPQAPTPPQGGPPAEYRNAVDNALGYFQWAVRTWSPSGPRDWFEGQIPFLQSMLGSDPRTLTDWEKQKLNRLFEKVKGRGIQYRVAAGMDPPEADVPKPRTKQNQLEKYTFHSAPAREWFNLGLTLEREDAKGNKQPIPMGEFRRAVSILKGKGISPSQAWAGEGGYGIESDAAAVYAAYEWIKGSNGETEFASTGDMDDILIDTVKALIGNPTLLRQIQSQFKVLLIDEAQDLNRVQHVMFGLMAGYLDPATLKPWPDGHMTADTYSLIGDDKQCVEVNTLISLPQGQTKRAGDMCEGDAVLSWRNGEIASQMVRHAIMSDWDWGYKVTLESGKSITMSPNHKLWATEPQTELHQVAVYLMFRSDMGYRVGITNKGKVGSDDSYLNSYGGRCFMEKAERLWILDLCENRDEALTKEAQYSLRYGIPTAVFCGENRGLNQDRIDMLFSEFGENGLKLLNDHHLSAHYPHWMSQSFTKHGRERHTVQLIAHTSSKTQVAMEWTGDKFDSILEGENVRVTMDGRRRLRRWFVNYRNALAFAEKVERVTGANLSQRLAVPGETPLRKITASGLHAGMSIPVHDENTITLEHIVTIEKVPGQFIDLDVDDASNFFGNGILTSNSIYEFRGADPEEFISKSNLVENGGDFKTKLLDMNFRSGEAIVQAANKLIAHNKRQVPMTCRANVDRNGQGRIISRLCNDVAEAADTVADEIAGLVESSLPGTTKYSHFGVAVRSNSEAYAYGVSMLKAGIPFKCNVQFFSDSNTKALIGWLTLADKGLDGDPNLIEDAIRDSVKAPFSNLGPAFFGAMDERARGSWARWLVDGGHQQVYQGGKWADILRHFVNNIEAVAAMTGTPAEIVEHILQLRGADGTSMRDAMIKSVTENSDLMAELVAESEKGEVSEDQIVEMALSPVAPLIGLMKGKDNLGSAMNYVRKLKDVNSKLATRDSEDEIDRDAVTIGTMHSWKGLEIPTMYIPMVGSKFPRANKEGIAVDGPELASERRLAYVAITRAEQRCVVLNIPHPKFATTSQFISEACIPMEGSNLPDDDADGDTAIANKVASRWAKVDMDQSFISSWDQIED